MADLIDFPDGDDDGDGDFYGDEPDEFEDFDCAMDRDGLCSKAGSEDCEWECPYAALNLRARVKAEGPTE